MKVFWLVVAIAIYIWLKPEPTEVSLDAIDNATGSIEPLADIPVASNEINKEKLRTNSNVRRCDNLINSSLIDDSWKKENAQWLLSKLIDLKRTTSAPVVDRVFIASGVGLYPGRVFTSPVAFRFQPEFAIDEAQIMDQTAQHKLNELLLENNVKGLKSFLETMKTKNTFVVPTKNEFQYLLGFLLLNFSETNAVVDAYLESNLVIKFPDLIVASQLGIELEYLSRLYEHSGLDAGQVLANYGVISSLVLESLKQRKYVQASYWMDMGSPVTPDSFHDNALDVLMKVAPEPVDEAWTTMVIDILETGSSPYWPASIKKLNNLLAPHEVGRYKGQIKRYQNNMSTEQKRQAKSITQTLHQEILQKSNRFTVEPLSDKCLGVVAKKLIAGLVRFEFQTRREAREQRRQESKDKKLERKNIEQERIDALIAEAEDKFSSKEEIEQFLGGEQLVENKRTVEKYRLKTYVDDTKLLAQQFPQAEPIAEDVRETIDRIMELANEGKWEEAIALLKQQDIQPQQLLDTLMIVAIYSPPDLAIIRQLLDEGANIPEDAINWLARKNDVERAKLMLPYGLKLYIRKGHLSSSILAIKSKSFDILKFMLENGVSLDANDMGMDELDYALINYTRDVNGKRFINLLFEHGAKVENSHRQLVEDIQRKDFVAHANLIADWPQLRKQEG